VSNVKSMAGVTGGNMVVSPMGMETIETAKMAIPSGSEIVEIVGIVSTFFRLLSPKASCCDWTIPVFASNVGTSTSCSERAMRMKSTSSLYRGPIGANLNYGHWR